MKNIVVLIILAFSIFSCTSSDKVKLSNDLIYLDKDTLRAGENFTFYYNSKNDKSKYKKGEDVVARLQFIKDRYFKYYNVNLEKLENGLYKGNFIAPDADVLIVLVAVEDQLTSMYRDSKEFPILEKNTKNLSKETLNYFMLRAGSEDEFNRLQNIDTSLYLENFDREFIFCRLIAEQGSDSIYIINRIKMLEKLVDGFYKDDIPVKLNLLVNLNKLYQLMGDWENSFIKLRQIQEIINSNNEYVSDNSLQIAFSVVPLFGVSSRFTTRPNKQQESTLVNLYVNLSKAFNSKLLDVSLLNYFSFSGLANTDNSDVKNFISRVTNQFENDRANNNYDLEFYNDCGIYLYDYYNIHKEYDKALRIAGYNLDFETKFSEFRFSKDTNDYFSAHLGNPYIEWARFRLAESHFNLAQYDKAKEIFQSIYKYSESRTESDMDALLSSLIDTYANLNQVDSTKYYIEQMYKLNCPSAPKKLSYVNTFLRSEKKDTLTRLALFDEFTNSYHKMVAYDKFEYQINDKNRQSNSFGDTTIFLLNIRDDCAVCNIAAVEINKILQPLVKSGKCKLIFASNLKENQLEEAFGKNLLISKRTKSMIKALNINDKDWNYLYIIKNNSCYKEKDYIKDYDYFVSFL